jgi:hypothetical protein
MREREKKIYKQSIFECLDVLAISLFNNETIE